MKREDISTGIPYLKKVLPRYFGELNEELFSEVSAALEWWRIERGELLFNQGDAGDSMYILFAGRLQAFTDVSPGKRKILGYVLHGESVGEMALITRENRSASVRAMRSSILIKLPESVFKKLVAAHPELLFNICKDIIIRQRRSGALASEFISSNILFVQATPLVDLDSVMDALGKALRQYATYRVVTPGSIRNDITTYSDEGVQSILSTLNKVEGKYNHVLFTAPYGNWNWITMAGLIVDKVYLLVDFDSADKVDEFERKVLSFIDREFVDFEIIFLHANFRQPVGTSTKLQCRNNLWHHHICLSGQQDFLRLSRILTGNAVALVLGGGGARGYAHIGVYKALTENGIPIDYVGGTSVGSSIAAGIAQCLQPSDLFEKSLQFNNSRPFADFTLPFFSLVAGKRMNRALQAIYGEAEVEDLWLRYYAVASNISRTSAQELNSGKVWKAVRASMSLPSVLPPVVLGNDILVDGGIFNNVPLDIMKIKYRCKVIAVDVSNSQDMHVPHPEFPSPFRFIASKLLNSKLYSKYPHFFSVIVKLTTIASASKLESDFRNAEIVLKPAVEKFGMMDLHRINDIVDAGYKAALAALPDINAKVAESFPQVQAKTITG